MSLGDDWVVGADGVKWRRAARVIVLDGDGRMLLVRGHDADQPERSWWFTVGGGIAPGETPREAAARELREETGIEFDAAALEGPVAYRTGVFRFFAETCRQDEEFFVARLDQHPQIDSTGWTDLERDVLDELAWMTPAQLRAVRCEYFPQELPDIAERLIAGRTTSVVLLGEQDDDALADYQKPPG